MPTIDDKQSIWCWSTALPALLSVVNDTCRAAVGHPTTSRSLAFEGLYSETEDQKPAGACLIALLQKAQT